MSLILHGFEHLQLLMSVYCDNSMMLRRASNMIKKHCLRHMKMCYYWTAVETIYCMLMPRTKTCGNYYTKHHSPTNHHWVHPYCRHTMDSSTILRWALMLCTLQGCVGNILAGYMCSSVLSDVPHRNCTGTYSGQIMFPNTTVINWIHTD